MVVEGTVDTRVHPSSAAKKKPLNWLTKNFPHDPPIERQFLDERMKMNTAHVTGPPVNSLKKEGPVTWAVPFLKAYFSRHSVGRNCW